MDKSVLKQFLKAGFVFENELFTTDDGTPQGGVISPILANMALDGMQKMLADRFHTNRLGRVDLRFKNAHKVNLVRYADDFIVTAATKEIAEEAKELIREFLKTRVLELSEEKTLTYGQLLSNKMVNRFIFYECLNFRAKVQRKFIFLL